MNAQKLMIPLLLLAAAFAATSAVAMTTSDNASKAAVSKAAAPTVTAAPAKPASGVGTKVSKEREKDAPQRGSTDAATAKK